MLMELMELMLMELTSHCLITNSKLGIIDNLVVVFKDQFDKAGNGMTIGWEWK